MNRMCFYLFRLVISHGILVISPFANAAQGDAPGYLQVNLEGIYELTFTKTCNYRSSVQVLKDHPYNDSDRVYGITMSDGALVEVRGSSSFIHDVRGVRTVDPLY